MSKRKPEQTLNDRIHVALFGMDPQRVENSVGSGTPDINYTGGWIESKSMPAWPKREDTAISIPHYTTKQRGWHSRRRRAGGRVHVVLEMARSVVFVFDAAEAASGLGHWTRAQMHRRALLVMTPWNSAAFRQFITQSDKDRAL